MKKILSLLLVAIIAGVAWYTLSPLLRNKKLNEESPLIQNKLSIKDNMESMNASTKKEFEKQVSDANAKKMPMGQMPMPAEAKLAAEGNFVPRAHDVQGKALLIEKGGKKILRFENFKTINGPDLHIWLASELSDRDYVELGPIKATEGNVNYDVPQGTDTKKYNKVLVWCMPFKVLFSFAELK